MDRVSGITDAKPPQVNMISLASRCMSLLCFIYLFGHVHAIQEQYYLLPLFPPLPVYKSQEASPLGKVGEEGGGGGGGGRREAKNESLINVCWVGDDFVATFVANGLCTWNNGLLGLALSRLPR